MSFSRSSLILLASACVTLGLGASASASSPLSVTDTFGAPLMPEAPICGHCKSEVADALSQVSLEIDLAGTVYQVGTGGALSVVGGALEAESDASGAVVVEVFFARGEWLVEVSPDRGESVFYATRDGETRLTLKGAQTHSLVFIALGDGGAALPSPRTVFVRTREAAQR